MTGRGDVLNVRTFGTDGPAVTKGCHRPGLALTLQERWKMDDTKILEDYRAAFRSANPGLRVPDIHYRGHGWYGVDGRDKRRLKDFVAWTERLRARVEPPPPHRGE